MYAKREMARDQVEVMDALGFETFAVVGHDRGARVTHRMALDHPKRIERLWGEHGFVGRHPDVLGVWRERAADVRGSALPSAHFLPEEAPAPTLAALQAFLSG